MISARKLPMKITKDLFFLERLFLHGAGGMAQVWLLTDSVSRVGAAAKWPRM